MYAVIQTGGKQYKVTKDLRIDCELLEANIGDKIEFSAMMFVDGDTVLVGEEAKNVKVQTEVYGHGKGRKINIFTYKPKKNQRSRKGHRQPFTTLKVVEIVK